MSSKPRSGQACPAAQLCAEGRHCFPAEELGQRVGCGVYIELCLDGDGEEYEQVIDEAQFLELCEELEMYYNWAPPMDHLDGMTQHEYFSSYWRARVPSTRTRLLDMIGATMACRGCLSGPLQLSSAR